MRLSIPLALATLSSLSQASPIHGHHIHKREAQADIVTQVVTQVITQVVDANGATIASTSSTTSPSTAASSTLQTTSTPSTTVLASSSTSAASAAASSEEEASSTVATSSSKAASSTSSKSSSSSTSTSSATIDFAKGGKGITYSPYTSSGACKDSSTIQSDIALLSQFDVIRLYDTDCSGVENVLAAKTSSQTLFAGIYYLSKIEASVQIISDAVGNVDGGWDNIYAVSVGNELVNAGTNTPSEISAAITSARGYLTTAGYSGSVVSVDTLVAVQNNPSLCDYSDFIAVNSHPYWDGSVYPDDAGTWLSTQISNIKSTCGGSKNVLITETGWPTQGDSYGVAVPSIANQKTAVEAIVDEVGDQVILFTTYNDLWKSAGSYGVEQYWGLIQSS